AGFLATAAIVVAILPGQFNAFGNSVPLRAPFALFPSALGGWKGTFGALDPASIPVLGTGDYLLADYDKPGIAPVSLYVIYYPIQQNGSVVSHSPTICIPAGGWIIKSRDSATVRLANSTSFEVNRLVIEKGLSRQVIYYWFNQGGHAVANSFI